MKNRKNKATKIAFVLYLLFLVWLVIFKFNFSLNDIHKVREVNLIPFYYDNVMEGDIPLFEALFNLLVFIPFGFLLHKIWNGKIYWKVSIILGLSLLFEITQYVLSVGASDITDLITNTLGGIIGIGCAAILSKKK
ncbi:MAG: VanZ family protein [Anaerovoracaceae bacterium]